MKRTLLLLGTLGLLSFFQAFSVANENELGSKNRQEIKAKSKRLTHRYRFIMHYPGRGLIVSPSYGAISSCQKNARSLQSTFGLKKQWICIKRLNKDSYGEEDSFPQRHMMYIDMGVEVLNMDFKNSLECLDAARKIKNYFKPLNISDQATFKYSCKVTYHRTRDQFNHLDV